MTATNTTTHASTRLASLDQFRGLLILLMMLENVLSMFSFMPTTLQRSGVYGVWHIADLGAPMFFFTIGVALGLSFDHYQQNHTQRRGVIRYIRRNLLLIVLGIIGVMLQGHNILGDWSVVQAIGGAGLVALPFMFLQPRWRWVAGLGLIIAFQFIVALGYGNWIRAHDGGGLGGVVGGLVWGAVSLFGASLSVSLRDNWSLYRRLSLMITAIGLVLVPILSRLQIVDKRLATTPYMAMTLALASLAMLFFAALERAWHPKLWLLNILGANALTIFVIQGLFVTIGSRYIPRTTPLGLALVISAAVFALCIGLAGWLNHKKVYLRL